MTIIIIIIIIKTIIIVNCIFFVIRAKRCFDVRKKDEQVARIEGRRGRGGLAMPKRKLVFENNVHPKVKGISKLLVQLNINLICNFNEPRRDKIKEVRRN